MTTLLKATALQAGYNGHAVVRDLDLEVRAGEVVGVIGPNGAGKTTSLLTLAGDLPAIGGTVEILDQPSTAPLHRRAKSGLSLVTEERSVIMRLSVLDNLRLADSDPEEVFRLFPELSQLTRRPAGLLSGGEQQMLTLGRALTRKGTRLLLADELSLGLAPLVVTRLLRAVRQAADERGFGVLLVEQHVNELLRVADRALVLERGSVVLSGTSSEVAGRLDEIQESYLAVNPRS